ncbi:hypothetical protein [Agromyces neolithicus]|uniref:hypothetical protein n=1 Tax=Agromyces neolithicus TaxID=269420 RepID=UPI0031E46BB8
MSIVAKTRAGPFRRSAPGDREGRGAVGVAAARGAPRVLVALSATRPLRPPSATRRALDRRPERSRRVASFVSSPLN